MPARRADRHPTWTSLVLEALERADDFLSMEHLLTASGAENTNQVSAALHHLAKYGAVESVVGGDGKLWWFATGVDNRMKIVEERAREPKGNRHRRRSAQTKKEN